ncbi:hypothetical protein TNCV_972681 [Trichonephila clavipes]|nr:hypothetical protein TNCV_972681 [Trichonephila clavipes]
MIPGLGPVWRCMTQHTHTHSSAASHNCASKLEFNPRDVAGKSGIPQLTPYRSIPFCRSVVHRTIAEQTSVVPSQATILIRLNLEAFKIRLMPSVRHRQGLRKKRKLMALLLQSYYDIGEETENNCANPQTLVVENQHINNPPLEPELMANADYDVPNAKSLLVFLFQTIA